MNTRKGFTLVELLVVIAILAILATVSVVGYTSFIDRADQSNNDTEAHQIESAIETILMFDDEYVISDTTVGTTRTVYVIAKVTTDGADKGKYVVFKKTSTLEDDEWSDLEGVEVAVTGTATSVDLTAEFKKLDDLKGLFEKGKIEYVPSTNMLVYYRDNTDTTIKTEIDLNK